MREEQGRLLPKEVVALYLKTNFTSHSYVDFSPPPRHLLKVLSWNPVKAEIWRKGLLLSKAVQERRQNVFS